MRGLAHCHDLPSILVRVWMRKYEVGELNDDLVGVRYDPGLRTYGLPRLNGSYAQQLELKFERGEFLKI